MKDMSFLELSLYMVGAAAAGAAGYYAYNKYVIEPKERINRGTVLPDVLKKETTSSGSKLASILFARGDGALVKLTGDEDAVSKVFASERGKPSSMRKLNEMYLSLAPASGGLAASAP